MCSAFTDFPSLSTTDWLSNVTTHIAHLKNISSSTKKTDRSTETNNQIRCTNVSMLLNLKKKCWFLRTSIYPSLMLIILLTSSLFSEEMETPLRMFVSKDSEKSTLWIKMSFHLLSRNVYQLHIKKKLQECRDQSLMKSRLFDRSIKLFKTKCILQC